jgi:hypothetical protein
MVEYSILTVFVLVMAGMAFVPFFVDENDRINKLDES